MQIHGPADETDTADFRTYLNPGTDRPFASVQMGHVGFFAYTPDECDAAIRVWAEAKRLLLAAQDTPAVLPRVHVHLFGQDGICTLCGTDIVTWSQAQGDAELDHIAIEGTLS